MTQMTQKNRILALIASEDGVPTQWLVGKMNGYIQAADKAKSVRSTVHQLIEAGYVKETDNNFYVTARGRRAAQPLADTSTRTKFKVKVLLANGSESEIKVTPGAHYRDIFKNLTLTEGHDWISERLSIVKGNDLVQNGDTISEVKKKFSHS